MNRYSVLVAVLLSVSVAAQAPPPKPAQPTAAPTFAPNIIDMSAGGQPVNIRLDVSVIDQQGSGAVQPKTLMVILADKAMGQTRAVYEDRSISVDARPTIVDGLIRVNVTVKSQEPQHTFVSVGPLGPGITPKSDPILNWTNSFALLLSNGKSMVALETMDAVTKRKLSIEVKATIQK